MYTKGIRNTSMGTFGDISPVGGDSRRQSVCVRRHCPFARGQTQPDQGRPRTRQVHSGWVTERIDIYIYLSSLCASRERRKDMWSLPIDLLVKTGEEWCPLPVTDVAEWRSETCTQPLFIRDTISSIVALSVII